MMPRSCGGGDEFKLLALYGDKIIDLALLTSFSNQGITDTGVISPAIDRFHNQDTLYALGKHLELNRLMVPLDSTQPIPHKDIKEGIEALLGATYQTHGLTVCFEVVWELYEKIKTLLPEIGAKEETLLSENVVGMLQEWFDTQGYEKPVYENIRVGGTDNNPLWKCQVTFHYQGEQIKELSDSFLGTRKAKRDAAQKVLTRLGIK